MALDPTYMTDFVEGKFGETRRDQLNSVFAAAAASHKETMLIYFHGGLVDKESGIENAVDLHRQFGDRATCLFPIWETGIWEVLARDWAAIAEQVAFKLVVDRVMSLVHAKAGESIEVRGAPLPYRTGVFSPDDLRESVRGAGDVTTAEGIVDLSNLEALSALQERQLLDDIERDTELTDALERAHREARAAAAEAVRGGPRPLLDPDALEAVTIEGEAVRTVGMTAALKVLGIIKAVIVRYVERKDHGLHATAVEEVLRALYIAAAGKGVWDRMKAYARQAFGPDGATCGGTAMLDEIERLDPSKKVLLIGHSAGSIFISEMLKAAAKRQMSRRIQVIFLAPAVRDEVFAEALSAYGGLVTDFRSFAMSNANEVNDTLVRTGDDGSGLTWFYPRSLLYFVSGLCEGEADAPLVGMERFCDASVWNAGAPAVRTVRDYLSAPGLGHACWSVCSDATGKRNANAVSHGSFGHTCMLGGVHNQTVDSIRRILDTGTF